MMYATWIINRSATSRLLGEKPTPCEAWTGRKANLAGVHTFSCMVVCLIPKMKRDHKLAPTGEWPLYLGMSEDNKAWLLLNLTSYKESGVRSAAFHEEKWLNTWRRERNEAPLDNQVPFEKHEESIEDKKKCRPETKGNVKISMFLLFNSSLRSLERDDGNITVAVRKLEDGACEQWEVGPYHKIVVRETLKLKSKLQVLVWALNSAFTHYKTNNMVDETST